MKFIELIFYCKLQTYNNYYYSSCKVIFYMKISACLDLLSIQKLMKITKLSWVFAYKIFTLVFFFLFITYTYISCKVS